MGFRQATGGFELKKIEESTPTKVVALVQERMSDQFARMSVEVDASEPHYIAKLGLQAIERPAEFALPHLSESELVTAWRAQYGDDTFSPRLDEQNVHCGGYAATRREWQARSKAPLGNYLTDYPNKDIASQVTIEQLLTHTGDTGDIFGPEFAKHRLELKTLQD